MQRPVEAQPVPERDLDEVLRSLEIDLFGPPKKSRERDDATVAKLDDRRPQ